MNSASKPPGQNQAAAHQSALQPHQSRPVQNQAAPRSRPSQQQTRPIQNQAAHQQAQPHNRHNAEPQEQKRSDNQGRHSKSKGFDSLLGKILPASVYNNKTKKIFGFLTAEDLLLVALIFLFLDSDEEGSNLMVLALAFVLLSDYIDLSGFAI